MRRTFPEFVAIARVSSDRPMHCFNPLPCFEVANKPLAAHHEVIRPTRRLRIRASGTVVANHWQGELMDTAQKALC